MRATQRNACSAAVFLIGPLAVMAQPASGFLNHAASPPPALVEAAAQDKASLAGDYSATLGPLHLNLHLTAGAGGALAGTLDSLDQKALGIALADIHLAGQALSFTVPAVKGKWAGTLAADGATLSGVWDQGNPTPLTFSRDGFVPGPKSRLDGVWLGTLTTPDGNRLRLQVTFRSDRAGREYGSLDSLDQGAMGLECSGVTLNGDAVAFDLPAVQGKWAGKLSQDGAVLDGTWSQGTPLPLKLLRQAAAIAGKTVEPPSYDPAAGKPADAAALQSLLDSDIAEALKSGELAPGTGAGVSIGVIVHGQRRVWTYGEASIDSVFEIGSISKTFTALILAQMVEQGKVSLDEPVRALLPPGTVPRPDGAEITLLDLATQHSGLPRMPDNFAPKDNNNPYADYKAPNLYAFLARRGVALPKDAGFLYSNLGFGLLGQALADRAGIAYPELLADEVTAPLGLRDTTIELSDDQRRRFIAGHDAQHHPTHAWDLVAMAGAGGIRSTAGDMLTYVDAQLHPGHIHLAAGKTVDAAHAATLAKAVAATHALRADAMPGTKIGLAWFYDEKSATYWHNGATGGYSSYAFFSPQGDYAGVVLLNASIGDAGSFADRLGMHLRARLDGEKAISLK